MVVLDATAGNRMIWRNKRPPNTIFMDKELKLAFPPDIFADNRYCPFRDKVFTCVIYDPPYWITGPPRFMNPGWDPRRKKSLAKFCGYFKSKTDMLTSIIKAQREFVRISDRLCLKWQEIKLTLWQLLPLFTEWNEIYRTNIKPKTVKSVYRAYRSDTFWVTFIPKIHSSR